MSVDFLWSGAGVVPAEDLAVAEAAQGAAHRAHLAHSAPVAPAAADEQPVGAGAFHDEHPALEVAEQPADGQLAADPRHPRDALHAKRARTARDPPTFDG